jgi:zinc protease
MEAKIRAAFCDWQPKAPGGFEPNLGMVVARGPETHIMVEPGIPSSIALNWTRAPDSAPDNLAKRRRNLIAELAIALKPPPRRDVARRRRAVSDRNGDHRDLSIQCDPLLLLTA